MLKHEREQLNSGSQHRNFIDRQDIVENSDGTESTREENQIFSSNCSAVYITGKGMSTDNTTGVQTRAMTEAQCIESKANKELANNLEQLEGAPNPAMNPTVDLHKAKEEAIKEFV